mmetsp:Transcript_2740/g.5110  ORF Transcript_2740/g.5110 Transcript_2740/m.5110 type:complete len:244 (+) Transcript_2740:94-825(+)
MFDLQSFFDLHHLHILIRILITLLIQGIELILNCFGNLLLEVIEHSFDFLLDDFLLEDIDVNSFINLHPVIDHCLYFHCLVLGLLRASLMLCWRLLCFVVLRNSFLCLCLYELRCSTRNRTLSSRARQAALVNAQKTCFINGPTAIRFNIGEHLLKILLAEVKAEIIHGKFQLRKIHPSRPVYIPVFEGVLDLLLQFFCQFLGFNLLLIRIVLDHSCQIFLEPSQVFLDLFLGSAASAISFPS